MPMIGYTPTGFYSPEDQARSQLMGSYDLASAIDEYNQQAAMSGQPGIASLDSVGDPKQYLQLLAASNPDLAGQFASSMGLDIKSLMDEASAAGYYNRAPFTGVGRVFNGVGHIGRTLQDNPALVFGGPLALAGALGAFGAGVAGGGGAAGGIGGAAGGGATTFPLASTGGAITATPIATGVGTGTIAGSTAAAGAIPAAAGGAASMAPGVGSALDAASAASAGASGLGGLGLGGWLTLGSLGAQALQGNKDITTNTNNEPPAYIAPYLSDAAKRASDLYGQGNYIAPVTQSAIDYTNNVLGGGFMGSNPYLDATFNKAAGAVTNQIQSNFGLAGRNPRGIDAAGFAQEGYNDLANQIYGGNYQAERQRQQQLVPFAGQLGAYTNPGTSLDDYIARLRNLSGGYGTTTSSTPTQSNWLNGLAGLGMLLMK